ncbi:polysaccharide lyase [Pendulispora brunnea]|uniref:Polysaccharide lyase n=1 Tax=Pendulispora brunnea TaxID=2905690 RepID=A0ABZ2KEA8_9BACT
MHDGSKRRRLIGAVIAACMSLSCSGSDVADDENLESTAPAETAASWQLKWSPAANRDGLKGFEGIEDDRANSHSAGQPHIFVSGNDYRFNMHMVDRDTATDRQRQEVKGMRTSSGSIIDMNLGETWKLSWSLYIPSSLKATTSFSHIMQLKMPGNGTSPILVMSLRRHGSTPKIEVKVIERDVLVGAIDLAPLQNKWIDTDLEFKIGDGSSGSVRWVVRDGSTTVIDTKKTGVDLWLGDRVRPKWGIYRSLGDSSGSLQDCYLLLSNMRGYQYL